MSFNGMTFDEESGLVCEAMATLLDEVAGDIRTGTAHALEWNTNTEYDRNGPPPWPRLGSTTSVIVRSARHLETLRITIERIPVPR